MEDTIIYGPRPDQPPVFTIDDVHLCFVEVAGIRAVLATGASGVAQAQQLSTRLVTELADWLDLDGFAPITGDHYAKFHRVGCVYAPPPEHHRWPFTFTPDPAGGVFLYPIPHKNSATVHGRLIAPRAPAPFTQPIVEEHTYPRGSDHDHLAHHLASVLALHRIPAAITVHCGDRTYRAPGNSVIGARICHPGGYTDSTTQQRWLGSVLSAITAVPQITARPDPRPASAGMPPDVLVEYHRPRRPWTIDAIDNDEPAH